MARKDDTSRGRDEQNTARWLTGHFLISEVNLADPNFQRTVVLMVNHDADGAFGLVNQHLPFYVAVFVIIESL